MVAFFEADGGVRISYNHLVNLNPQTTDVMAVACSVTPNSSSRNHGSVENGSQYQVPFIENFHFTMILGFLGAHPPNATPSPKKYGLYQNLLKGSWCPKKSPKKGRLFLGRKGWHSGGWWEAVGPLDFEETLQGKIIHHLCSGACILGGWLIQPNMNQGAIFKGWNSLDRAMMAPKAMRKNSSMEGSSWWKTETRKKNSSEDEVIYGMYVIYDIEKNMGPRRWIFWTTTFTKELILISWKFCWGLFNESVLKTKRSYIFLLPTTTRQTHLKAENAGAVLVTDGSNGLWGATGIAHIAIVAWTEFGH